MDINAYFLYIDLNKCSYEVDECDSYLFNQGVKYFPYLLIEKRLKNIVDDESIPIIKTSEIGHGKDSKCIVIGENISLHR